jgi:hypothetical protein
MGSGAVMSHHRLRRVIGCDHAFAGWSGHARIARQFYFGDESRILRSTTVLFRGNVPQLLSNGTGTYRFRKVAVTALLASIMSVHTPVPEQPPPLHPMKIKFFAGVAVSVTVVPAANACEQALPH